MKLNLKDHLHYLIYEGTGLGWRWACLYSYGDLLKSIIS